MGMSSKEGLYMTVTLPWVASEDAPTNGVAAKIDEIRQALGDEAEDGLKAVSPQIDRASGWANDLFKAAAGVGTALTLNSRKTAQDLGDNAQSLTRDLRNLRVTTEPKRTNLDFMPGITMLAGFAAGTALMYFLDPERGQDRRNLVRDKLTSWSRRATATAQRTSSQLRGQMLRSPITASDEPFTSGDLAAPDDAGPSADTTTGTWAVQPQTSPWVSPVS